MDKMTGTELTRHNRFNYIIHISLILAAMAVNPLGVQAQPGQDKKMQKEERPKVGDIAPDFTLKTLDDKEVTLSKLVKDTTVVLVMLRGYPGYQCPICSRQVTDFIVHAKGFEEQGARVLFVYPGPSEYLNDHAKEFIEMQKEAWPKNLQLVCDPDYKMVNAYHLRWDAPRETAFPSTFILDHERKIKFAEISDGHGGRTKAEDIIQKLTPADEESQKPTTKKEKASRD